MSGYRRKNAPVFFCGKRNGFGIKPYLEGETPEKEAQDLEDGKIVGLYLMRSESAISETDAKYGSLMLTLSKRILGDGGAAEECLNDAYLGLWNSIPPEEPQNLRAYCCKVIRNLSFKRLQYSLAQKRTVHSEVPLDGLEASLSDGISEAGFDDLEFESALNAFLDGLKPLARVVFLKRYFFFDTVPEIAGDLGISESRVKSLLWRTRRKYAEKLTERGVGCEKIL